MIDGSLSIIAEACAEVGVRVNCSYGVTDRHGPAGAAAGLAENDRFLRAGGRGMVGLHAAFTCSDDTIAAAAEMARNHGVGVHVHVAEGPDDTWQQLSGHTADDWWLIHGVHLPDDHRLRGTIVHNPRSNMNNAVGYARPQRFAAAAEGRPGGGTGPGNPIALGTDGIGADMLDEFRGAFVRSREHDVTTAPDQIWGWLETGRALFPETANDLVTWTYPVMDPWRLAYTTQVSPTEVAIDGTVVFSNGSPTLVDAAEVEAKAAEAAARLFAKL
jgi:cytosine/adenosine deaminase-related metal-dependent hydrolase